MDKLNPAEQEIWLTIFIGKMHQPADQQVTQVGVTFNPDTDDWQRQVANSAATLATAAITAYRQHFPGAALDGE